MRKLILMATALVAFSPLAQAGELMDWLENAAANSRSHGQQQEKAADAAQLVTLENGEEEMYPQPSPDGRFVLTLSEKSRSMWVSRRYSENGDQANQVTNDSHAFDSVAWKDNGKVYFLSDRAGGLGLWEKISDGEGMQRRIMSLHGYLTQPVVLADESVIAVRLVQEQRNHKRPGHRTSRDNFNNWDFPGYRTELVRFDRDGAEKVLVQGGVNPALSPDGEWIVFSMPTGRSMHLFRMRTDGSDLIQVTDARSVDVQPAWSANGKQILFTSNRADADMRHPSKSGWDIWAIGSDGRNLTQISFDDARDGAPRADAQGRIYFHSDRDVSKAQQKLHQIRSAGRHHFHVWKINMPSATAKP